MKLHAQHQALSLSRTARSNARPLVSNRELDAERRSLKMGFGWTQWQRRRTSPDIQTGVSRVKLT